MLYNTIKLHFNQYKMLGNFILLSYLSFLICSCVIYRLIVSSHVSADGARLGSPRNASEVLSDAVALCLQDTEGDARRRWRQAQGQMISSRAFMMCCTAL